MLESIRSLLEAPGSGGLAALLGSYLLILLAEIGDKSQLVAMTLAARHRGLPVLLGAAGALVLLNVLAVVFGAAAAQWLPQRWLALAVAGLFLLFGVQALRAEPESAEDVQERSGRGVFLTSFVLVFLAEFGDKTQIAVAGLAGLAPPVQVWAGASLALVTTTGLGVWAGRRWLQRLPVRWLHRGAGVLFLLFAAWTLLELVLT